MSNEYFEFFYIEPKFSSNRYLNSPALRDENKENHQLQDFHCLDVATNSQK